MSVGTRPSRNLIEPSRNFYGIYERVPSIRHYRKEVSLDIHPMAKGKTPGHDGIPMEFF